MPKMYRTCQECLHVQEDMLPVSKKSIERYKERLCDKCLSPGSLDWGSANPPSSWKERDED
jgi:hypothetical protein